MHKTDIYLLKMTKKDSENLIRHMVQGFLVALQLLYYQLVIIRLTDG